MSLSTTITALQQAKTDIYDAIVEKGGDISPGDGFSDFPAGIRSISGSSLVVEEVNFYDLGSLVASYTLAEAQNLTALPAQPDHSGDDIPLTGQGWNYTLEQVNALTGSCDIGALYATTDGKTHFLYTITTVTGGSPTLTINNTGGGTLTVNWGDGSADLTASGTGDKTFTPVTAIQNGSYDLTISSTANYAMPTRSDSTFIFGSFIYNQCITKGYLSSQVTSIGETAFFGCYSLTSITIPQGVTSIGESAFFDCFSLTSITIPQGVTSIGPYTFNDCYSLTSITIPQGVTSIEDYTFFGCYSLTSITIPQGVTSIGETAFSDCYSLTSITIPQGVTSIGESAFFDCFSLTSITIPQGVTSIGPYTFGACYSLTSITIPQGVTSIEDDTFSGCYSCCIYDFSRATSVPTLSYTSAFTDINPIAKILVPSALLSSFQTATNWSTYSNYMVGV